MKKRNAHKYSNGVQNLYATQVYNRSESEYNSVQTSLFLVLVRKNVIKKATEFQWSFYDYSGIWKCAVYNTLIEFVNYFAKEQILREISHKIEI